MNMKKLSLLLAFSLASILLTLSASAQYNDAYRPQFHFTRPTVKIGDPCAMLHYKGVWRCFSWDQQTSTDLVYWSIGGWPFRGPIPPGNALFTGSGVVDLKNSSGFGSTSSPPMIIAYTLHDNSTMQENIAIASSVDYVNFNSYNNGNPVINAPTMVFRDCDVSWDEQLGLWIMLVSQSNQIDIYTSTDLKSWQFKSAFAPGGGQFFECPGIARIPVKGVLDKKKWVLYSGPGTKNCQYWVGNFDGTTFTQDGAPQAQGLFLNAGMDFYAARVIRDFDGGQCVYMIAWQDNWDYAGSLPTSFGSGWTIPRRLQLLLTAQGYKIVQEPLAALQNLRGPLAIGIPRKLQGSVPLTEFQPTTNTYEIIANFQLTPQTQKFGFNLCVGGGNKVVLGYDVAAGNLFLDRTHSGNTSFSPNFPVVTTAPFSTSDGKVKFQIFVDQNSVEVFVNDGLVMFSSLIFPASTNTGIELWSDNAVVQLKSLSAWPLKSIWH